MKNNISPLWEDIENRNGSICSIKIDSLKAGIELLKKLLICLYRQKECSNKTIHSKVLLVDWCALDSSQLLL